MSFGSARLPAIRARRKHGRSCPESDRALMSLGRSRFLATVAGSLLAAPLAAEVQQAGKVYRIGLLFNQLPSTFPGEWAFYERMRELGWVHGRDFVAEHRVYGDQYERVPD